MSTPDNPATMTRIIDKIRKLFALAGNNTSEAEAASALAKAQEMLASYNLEMSMLDDRAEVKKHDQGDGKRTKEKVERSAMFAYIRKLWEALADTNFCVYWNTRIYTNGVFSTYYHYLIGREDNVAVVKLMGEYLEQTLNRQCPYKVGKDVNLWKTGCVERIVERLAAKKSEMTTADFSSTTPGSGMAASTAVVLRSVYEDEAHKNYQFQYPNGDWCPCLRCRTRRNDEYRARRDAMPDTPAVAVHNDEKAETPAQTRRREEKEARQRERWNRKYDRQYQREWEKRNSEAFISGRDAGEKVNLDSQVGDGKDGAK